MKGGDETLEKKGSHKSLMAEKGGFEPPQGLHLLPVFETGPFSHLGISPTKFIITHYPLFAIHFSL